MGGASTQVSFSSSLSHQVKRMAKIAGKMYKLYAKSYLGYGAKEVRDGFFKFLIKKRASQKGGKIKSPCHHNGWEDLLEVSEYDKA